jgi:hypothetical protein
MITRMDHHSSTACHCGCAPCVDRCCELECHSRPRFFCGQLLTDEDLSAMVGWAASKFRLQRYRTGWGVACGLEVTCDPKNPQGVLVTEGYAVSCCGDDIIVCADTPLDLSVACQIEDPCADPEEAIKAAAEKERRRERERLIDELGSKESSGDSFADAVMEAIGRELADDGTDDGDREEPQVRWVDVFVRYAEQDDDLRATHGHRECAAGPDCEPAKVRESSELHWERGAPRPDKVATAAWCDGYEKCLEVLRRYQRLVGGSDDWAAVRRSLCEWVEQHPPRVFCGLRDLIRDLSDDELADRLVGILAKLAIDCRITYSRRDCHTCECDQGVRLARIYLGPATAGGKCRVLCIDAFPPYRRQLSRSEAPAPLGSVNVGSLIGADWHEACVRLAELGVRAQPVELKIDRDEADGVDDLLRRLDCGCGPIVAFDDDVDVLVMEFDGPMQQGWRVVGFCSEQVRVDQGKGYHPPPAGREARPESVVPGSAPVTAEETRVAEIERWEELNGVGDAIAVRLVDNGLTVEAVVAMDLDEAVREVQGPLPANLRARARPIVEEARRAVSERGSEGF